MSDSNRHTSIPLQQLEERKSADPQCHQYSPLTIFLVATFTTIGAVLLSTVLRRLRRKKPLPPNAPAVCALVRAWLSVDPDPVTRDQVQSLLLQYLSSQTGLTRLLVALDSSSRLRFGTAGLRAEIGPGYDRFNSLVVLAAAQALARVSRPTSRVVVVGHDARAQSRKFAVLVADVFRQYGAQVRLFSRPVPTPWVAFAVLKFNAAIGLCVTASHNPPKDNGLKVFWNDGIQIRPHIAQKVESIVKDCARPWHTYALTDEQLPPLPDPYQEVTDAYLSAITTALSNPMPHLKKPKIVYTACHGVGTPFVQQIFERFQLPPLILVKEQCTPDPMFPTLPFPNPEEKDALDLAIETAKTHNAQIILANDPDADRLGVAEIAQDGSIRIFNGDEIALLFADYLTVSASEDLVNCAVVASTVSSKILASMARKRGFTFREALTGFKWINKVALDLEHEGKTVLLSYEEAIGYNVTRNIVRDKDGVSASAVFAQLAAFVYNQKKTLVQRMRELVQECGPHISNNGYYRASSESPTTTAIFEAARSRGLPKRLGSAVVTSVRDLTYGTDTAEEDGKSLFPCSSASQFLTFRCSKEGDSRDACPLIIHLRGSGTGKILHCTNRLSFAELF